MLDKTHTIPKVEPKEDDHESISKYQLFRPISKLEEKESARRA